jgi:Flp pilus assembly protein TadB
MTTADGTAKRRRRVTDTVENLTRERSDDTSNGDSKKEPEFVVAPLTALCVAALTRNLDHIPYLGIGYIIANATVSPSCCV